VIARTAGGGLAGLECDLPAAEARGFAERLVAAGAGAASPALLEERRILAGFPRLGAEIDDRTLPQEVRLDEVGAVSFTKGCYLGQETVARLHFRGHANRRLAGLALEREPAALPLDVLDGDGRVAGRLSSACWWDAGAGWVGLGVVRRLLEDGCRVELADGGAATLHPLPWEDAAPAAAGGPAR
jgi:tRNA-modifying protein YgfZ